MFTIAPLHFSKLFSEFSFHQQGLQHRCVITAPDFDLMDPLLGCKFASGYNECDDEGWGFIWETLTGGFHYQVHSIKIVYNTLTLDCSARVQYKRFNSKNVE